MSSENAFGKLQLEAGQTLFRAGEAGDFAYFIESGAIEIFVVRHGERIPIARRGAGELIGEMAIIDGARRSAFALAAERCQLLSISRAQLQRRLESTEPVLRACVETVLARFRSMIETVEATANGFTAGHADAGPATVCDEVVGTLRFESDIAAAIEKGEFRLHYQPIIALQTGRICGFEALMRWQHPELGQVPPSRFIPAAEAADLIPILTDWTLKTACAALASFNRTGAGADRPGEPLFVSVNVSGRDLERDDFCDTLAWLLDDGDTDPHQLRLEVTETALMTHAAEAGARLERCRALGCGIAIDDFGTGYSSLAYLRQLPFTTLKIDRSFIGAMHNDELSKGIIRTILTLGRELGVTVVAEGIETVEEAHFLREAGCELAQGFLFARPVPLESALGLVAEGVSFPETGAASVADADRPGPIAAGSRR